MCCGIKVIRLVSEDAREKIILNRQHEGHNSCTSELQQIVQSKYNHKVACMSDTIKSKMNTIEVGTNIMWAVIRLL